MPSVLNFRADYDNNGSILLAWDVTALPPNQTICDRSKRFMVRVFAFASYEDIESGPPSSISPFMNTMKRRETTFKLPLSDQFSLDKYYKFSIKNQHILGSTIQVVVREQVNTSDIFYFGQQGESIWSSSLSVPNKLALPASSSPPPYILTFLPSPLHFLPPPYISPLPHYCDTVILFPVVALGRVRGE